LASKKVREQFRSEDDDQKKTVVRVMDEEVKKSVKKLAEETEIKITKTILRWKYKKEGKPLPTDEELEDDSKQTANRAHDIIAKRGKNIWEELKKVYSRDKNKGKGSQG
jgi:hypothetical protein